MSTIEQQIEQARSELEQLKVETEKSRQRQELEKQELEENLNTYQRIVETWREKGQAGAPIHVYAECMKVARQSDVIPSYALSLEAQLCRSLHHMDMFRTSLSFANKYSDGLQESYKRQIAHVAEERGLTEINLLNSICAVESERKELKEEHIKRLRQQDEAYASLRRKRHQPTAMDGETKEPESAELDRIMVMIDDVVNSRHTRRENLEKDHTEIENPKPNTEERTQEFNVIISLTSMFNLQRRGRVPLTA